MGLFDKFRGEKVDVSKPIPSDITDNREARIKLYKKIRNKYYNEAGNLPHDEIWQAIEAGFLVEGYESFSSHNDAIEKAKERVTKIDKNEIADAFLYSLSKSLCEYRSPLLSYYVIKSVNIHDFDDMKIIMDIETYSGFCTICEYNNRKEQSGFYCANYALIKKYLNGSVCWFSYYIDNCIMDISQYLEMPKVKPDAQDRKIMIEALELTEQLKSSDKAGAYIKLLYESKIIPNSTKVQISTFVETLGSLNILHHEGDFAITKGREKYDSTFREPMESKNDHPFPLTHWHASDGVDWDEVHAIFNIP